MKIALLGNNEVDYCSEVHYQKTLQSMGHEVFFITERRSNTEDILKIALQCDMFVWIHSHGFENPGTLTMREVLAELKEAGVPSVAYHLDLYMGLERWKEYQTHEYFDVEYFFTVDKLMADWLNENTKTKAFFLEAGVFDQECVMLPKQPVRYDTIFAGAKNYHKEWPYRPKLVQWLEDNLGKRFIHIGGDGAGVFRGLALNQIYANAKVVVGDSLNPDFNYPYYSSDRFFETMGRGGFLIYPKIEGFAPDYVDGVHVVYYKHGDLEDLRAKLQYYLNHDDEREQIRINGFTLTKEKNTYKNRWQSILDTVFGEQDA